MNRFFFPALVSLWVINAINVTAQTAQKLSIGLMGGIVSPANVTLQGEQPEEFKSIRAADLSKGLFLQYDLSDNFYVRSSFKTSSLVLDYRFRRNVNDSLKFDFSYKSGFAFKQVGLELGYRGKITNKVFFTCNLGGSFLDLKNSGKGDLEGFTNRRDPFQVLSGSETIKEKSFMVSGAVGLEYKNKQENVFSLELGYYKGFTPIGRTDFNIVERFTGSPNSPIFTPSLITKGDYAEIRVGYRMPVQKLTNVYKAVRTPRVKSTPEPDSIKNSRFIGKYWGLEIGRQNFYANQIQNLPNFSEKNQSSPWVPYLTFNRGFYFQNRFILEGGIRLGAGSITAVGRETIGLDNNWTFLMLTVPISLRYSYSVYRNKIFISPELGIWQTYAPGIGNTDSKWIWQDRIGTVTNIESHIKGNGKDYFIGYHAGISLNGRFWKNAELGFGYRFSDRFSKKPVVLNEINYDQNNIPQPAIVAKSNLKNDAITISFRKFLGK